MSGPGPTEATGQAGSSPSAAPGNDVLNVLSAFEQSMAQVKQLYAERQAAEARLEQITQTLRARDELLGQREAELAQIRRELDEMRARVDVAGQEAERQSAELRQRLDELEQGRAGVEARAAELDALRAELDGKRLSDEAAAQKLAAELDQLAQELQALQVQLDQRSKALEAEKASLDAFTARLTEREQALEVRARDLQQQEDRLTAARAELEKDHEEFGSQLERLARITEIERACVELRSRLEAAEAQATKAAGELAEARAQVGQAADTAKAQSEAQTRAEHDARARERAELQGKLVDAEAAAVRHTGEITRLQAALTKAENDAAELLRMAEAADQRQQDATTKLAAAEQAAARRISELESALAAKPNSTEAESPTPASASGDGGATAAEVQELESIIEQLRDRLRVEITKSRELEERAAAAEAGTTDQPDAAAITEIRTQLDEAQRELTHLRHQNERLARQAHAAGPMVDKAWLETRHARLRRCRVLLRDQSRKVRKAGDVLARRFESCEQLLAQRQDLVTAKRAVDQAQRKLQKQRAGGRAAATAFYTVGTLGLLAGISWAVVGQAIPGEYAASTAIAPSGRGRELSVEEQNEWEQALRGMLTDPSFLATAAERMSRRGIESLGDPTLLRDRLAKALIVDTPQPGRIALEYRDTGAGATQRVLDTLVVTLSGEANILRDRRADGAVTEIIQAAAPGDAPIHDQRLLHASVFFGATTLLTALGTLVLWSRLAKAKSEFEMSSQVDDLLADARWVDPKAD